MWLPKFEGHRQGLAALPGGKPQVRAYLEEFAMTKRQFARAPR